jgi:hypothetical protein
MNELRAEIKKLMTLARGSLHQRNDAAPSGFAARVVARSQLIVKPSILSLQWAFSVASWTAAFVIISCSVVLLKQHRATNPASEIVAAVQHFAETISP